MKIKELLIELSFHGSQCTKDCSGHSAGYAWSMQHKGTAPCGSNSQSFNNGCNIAAGQLKANKVVRPKVRTARGTFAPNPQQPRKPVVPKG